MLWFLYTTGCCNLKCKYCGGSFPERIIPKIPTYNIQQLLDFLNQYKSKRIFFYGGEPLLNKKFIEKIIFRVNAKRIGLQTNGILLNKIGREMLNKFDVILISIDGREKITDKYRGKGVYKKVIENVKHIRKIFKGEIIARMTVTEDTDIYEDVNHLLKLGLFDKIHWQLNVIWCEKWNVSTWANRSYFKGLKKLLKMFLKALKRGIVLKIVPIMGIINTFIFKPFTHVPCGAGKYSFTIDTNGRILACPIAVYESWAILGDIYKGLNELKDVKKYCFRCSYFKHCGGRCLYAQYENFWGIDGFKEVCKITIKTIKLIEKIIPTVYDCLNKRVVRIKDLYYNPLNDSTEVIP